MRREVEDCAPLGAPQGRVQQNITPRPARQGPEDRQRRFRQTDKGPRTGTQVHQGFEILSQAAQHFQGDLVLGALPGAGSVIRMRPTDLLLLGGACPAEHLADQPPLAVTGTGSHSPSPNLLHLNQVRIGVRLSRAPRLRELPSRFTAGPGARGACRIRTVRPFPEPSATRPTRQATRRLHATPSEAAGARDPEALLAPGWPGN